MANSTTQAQYANGQTNTFGLHPNDPDNDLTNSPPQYLAPAPPDSAIMPDASVIPVPSNNAASPDAAQPLSAITPSPVANHVAATLSAAHAPDPNAHSMHMLQKLGYDSVAKFKEDKMGIPASKADNVVGPYTKERIQETLAHAETHLQNLGYGTDDKSIEAYKHAHGDQHPNAVLGAETRQNLETDVKALKTLGYPLGKPGIEALQRAHGDQHANGVLGPDTLTHLHEDLAAAKTKLNTLGYSFDDDGIKAYKTSHGDQHPTPVLGPETTGRMDEDLKTLNGQLQSVGAKDLATFQKEKGLPESGVFDAATRNKLGEAVNEAAAEKSSLNTALLANMKARVGTGNDNGQYTNGNASENWCAGCVSTAMQDVLGKQGLDPEKIPLQLGARNLGKFAEAHDAFHSISDIESGKYTVKVGDVVVYSHKDRDPAHPGALIDEGHGHVAVVDQIGKNGTVHLISPNAGGNGHPENAYVGHLEMASISSPTDGLKPLGVINFDQLGKNLERGHSVELVGEHHKGHHKNEMMVATAPHHERSNERLAEAPHRHANVQDASFTPGTDTAQVPDKLGAALASFRPASGIKLSAQPDDAHSTPEDMALASTVLQSQVRANNDVTATNYVPAVKPDTGKAGIITRL